MEAETNNSKNNIINEKDEKKEEEELEWRVHPFTNDWKRAILVIIILFFVWIGIYYIAEGDILLTTLSVVILLGTLAPYFMVSHYHLDSENVKQKRGSMVVQKKWSVFRKYYVGKNYIQLSPFSYNSRLEAFRSMTLLVDKDIKEDVLNYVKKHIAS